MAVRIETHTTTKDIAVIEIPQSGKKKLQQINFFGIIVLLVSFALMIVSTLVLGRLVADLLPERKTPGDAIILGLTLMGSLGLGIYCLLKIARYLDGKTDVLLKSYGWDGEMSHRIEYID